MPQPVIEIDQVGKKFCRDLQKSLWYGVKDCLGEFIPRGNQACELRPGEFWANKDISFSLAEGQCLGLIGHNGAGKTTLLKLLSGLIKPDTGKITTRGTVGAMIALGAGFNPILTGRENIFINSSILGYGRRETRQVLDDIVAFADLKHAIDAPVRTYSSGMQVRLGFAVASQFQPKIMLVDEVLAVGDSRFQKSCFERIHAMRNSGTSFIVVSHNPYQLESLCNLVAVMDRGQVVTLDKPREAIHQYHCLIAAKPRASTSSSNAALTPEVESREGTGEARFQSVCILNSRGVETNEIETGKKVHIRAHCLFKEQASNVRFRFTISNDSSQVIANIGSNSLTEDIVFSKGVNLVELEIPVCNLMHGVYSLDAAIVSGTGFRIDRFPSATKFTVQTRSERILATTAAAGAFYLDAAWAVNRD